MLKYLGLLYLLLPAVHPLNVTFEPPELDKFRTDETRSLLVRISGLERGENITVEAECEDTFLCRVINQSGKVDTAGADAAEVNVTIRADFLGFTRLNLRIDGREYTYPLRLLRSRSGHVVAKTFASTVTVFVLLVTFMMGTQLKIEHIAKIAKKPIGPVVGFVCQFGLMPTIGFLLANYCMSSQDVSVRLALFAVATCPGGGKSSFWTIIFNGNLDLSISMTFFQTLASTIMMPLWLKTLGTQFMDDTRITIPFSKIFKSLLGLVLPTMAGMALTHVRPQYVALIQKWIKRVVWGAMITLTIGAIYANFYMVWLVNWNMFICGCALPWLGYLAAFIVAACCRQTFKDTMTIAIETGIQNIGIAMVLIYMCLPEPESDISFTIIVVTAILTDKPLVCIYLGSRLYQRICKGNTVTQKKGSKLEEDESSVEMQANILETEREELEEEDEQGGEEETKNKDEDTAAVA